MMQCPKCHAQMHTYNRNGVQIEQCSGCRGIFLDYGELESLTRLESQWAQQAPPPPPAPQQPYPQAAPPVHGPAWGARSTVPATAGTTATAARRASAGCSSRPDSHRTTEEPPVMETTGGSRWCAILGLNQ